MRAFVEVPACMVNRKPKHAEPTGTPMSRQAAALASSNIEIMSKEPPNTAPHFSWILRLGTLYILQFRLRCSCHVLCHWPRGALSDWHPASSVGAYGDQEAYENSTVSSVKRCRISCRTVFYQFQLQKFGGLHGTSGTKRSNLLGGRRELAASPDQGKQRRKNSGGPGTLTTELQ